MSDSTAARRFVGVWRLEAIRDRLPDGRVQDHPDFGPEPDGFLVYTDSGHVSVQFMRRDRPPGESRTTRPMPNRPRPPGATAPTRAATRWTRPPASSAITWRRP